MRTRRLFVSTLMIVATLALALPGAAAPATARAADGAFGPQVIYPVHADISPELRSLAPKPLGAAQRNVYPEMRLPRHLNGTAPDPVVQDATGPNVMPPVQTTFQAINNFDNYPFYGHGWVPPDTEGDIGPNHYIQYVNAPFAIYSRTGTRLYGPALLSTVFTGFGGPCELYDDGDPIVQYDQLADRWLLSQFALPQPFYECIAVSATSDPLGAWYRYAFLYSATEMNDYPKLSVWPDGYYMSVNQFLNGATWDGAGAVAFERAKMLTGDPTAAMIYFNLGPVNINFGGQLPADLDGMRLPPAGEPNFFAEVDTASEIPPTTAMRIWKFHVDWTTPANSTFGLAGQPNYVVPVAAFTRLSGSVPQPPPANAASYLDSLGDRIMFRLAYRNFGDHEALVVNHTVSVGAPAVAGVRWYEVRDPNGTPTVYQQGTFAPADGTFRWMGSAAMDHVGNLAIGYSASSSTLMPSIYYAGRLVTDPLGTLGQGEGVIITGSGVQTTTSQRWGDYSALVIDPVDDCTFWYTNEYYTRTSRSGWNTQVATFRFPSCTMPTSVDVTSTSAAPGSLAGVGQLLAGLAAGALVAVGLVLGLRLRNRRPVG